MGLELSHVDVGKGSQTILFIHAFPLDRRMWRQNYPASGGGFRVIVPDLRGFGASAKLPLHDSIDRHADDLASFLDALKITKVVAVGISMGGYIALALARLHASRLSGLLLADTKGTSDGEAQRQARQASIETVERDGVSALFEKMIPNLFTDGTPPSIVDTFRQIAATQSSAGVTSALRAMRDRADSTPHLAHIKVPTRVVVGRDDKITPLADADALASSIPCAKRIIIERAGHSTCIEQPEAFAAALGDLLAETNQ
ncbi:MAG: alpha/beta fold hydrolase [Polyangiales bacterium]